MSEWAPLPRTLKRTVSQSISSGGTYHVIPVDAARDGACSLNVFRMAIYKYLAERIRWQHPISSRSQSHLPRRGGTTIYREQPRVIKWISIGECKALLAESSDVIVVDLRVDAQHFPLPILPIFVLPVTTNELDSVLKGFPPDKSVVFCGATNLSMFMILTGPFMEGPAPLYFLEGDLDLAEVA